jgi:hypothetical protein
VSAGGLSKTAQRELRSMTDHDDRLWRLAYAQGYRDARQQSRKARRSTRRRFSQWWAVITVVALVGDLSWPYRYLIGAALLVMVWMLVIWYWWGRDRVQRWLGERWMSRGRF